MAKKDIANLPAIEPSQFMREMWAAEAEHPVFAGSLLNLRFMAAGASKPKSKQPAKVKRVSKTVR